MIPNQLQKNNFRFVRVNSPKTDGPSAGKKPLGIGWTKDNNDEFNSERLKKHINNGGNYGVIGGFNGLVIIDIDDEKANNILKDILPETFTVKTRNGFHYYYINTNINKKIILIDNKTDVHYGEIQSTGSMVVGPGSTHKTGFIYKIEKDISIKFLHNDILNKVLNSLNVIINKNENLIVNTKVKNNLNIDISNLNNLYKLKIENIINFKGNIKHPFHESTSGQNFSVNKGLARCWQHNVTFNAIQFLAMKSKYLTCEDTGTPITDIDELENIIRYKAKNDYGRIILFAYLQAKKDGLIKFKDTPLPNKAVFYLGKKLGLINKAEYDVYYNISPIIKEQIEIKFNIIKLLFKRGKKIEI